MKNYIRDLGFLLLGFMVLLVWRFVYESACYTILLPLLIGVIIALSIRESFLKKKECTAECYFKDKSFLNTLVRGKFFVNIFSFMVSLMFSLALILYLTIASLEVLVFLFFDIFVIYILYLWLVNSTKNSLNAKIRYSIIKDWVVVINSFLFLFVLIYIQLNAYVPTYINSSLSQSIVNASTIMGSSCDFINYLVKLNIEKEAITWWFMLNISTNINNEDYRLIFWMIFLVNSGLSTFAYSRFMVQIVDFSYKIDRGAENAKQ